MNSPAIPPAGERLGNRPLSFHRRFHQRLPRSAFLRARPAGRISLFQPGMLLLLCGALFLAAGCRGQLQPPQPSYKPSRGIVRQGHAPESGNREHRIARPRRTAPAPPRATAAKAKAPRANRLPPPVPTIRVADAYDPRRPCFSRRRMNRATGVLFGPESSVPGKRRERWAAAINRTFHILKASCADKDFLVLVLTTIQLESGVSQDPALENRDLEALFSSQLEKIRSEIPLAGKVLDRSTLDDALRLKLRKDTRRGHVRSEGDLVRYVEGDLRRWLATHLRNEYFLPEAVARFTAEKALANPVKTLGPMQVNLNKAYANARRRGEKVNSPQQMRKWMLDPATALERGIREGTYQLWRIYRYYRKRLPPEQTVRFVTADYNAGEFSSRNAAFQQRVARLTGHPLTLDGDLLLYRNSHPASRASNTESAVITLLSRYAAPSVRRDLLLEKEESFAATSTWKMVCARFRKIAGKPCVFAIVPAGAANAAARIKLGRTYTPENYANAYLARWRRNRQAFGGGVAR